MTQRSAPYVLGPEESIRPQRYPGGAMLLRVGAQDSAGALSVYEAQLPPGVPGPPLHVHDDEDEAIYVLSGTVLVQLGDDRHEVGPGSFAWLPRGVPHTFANVGDEPARGIGINTPGGIEAMFNEQAEYFAALGEGEPPDMERLAEMAARHGSRVVGPPIGMALDA